MLEYILCGNVAVQGNAEQNAREVTRVLDKACDATMPRNCNGVVRNTKMYRWIDHINSLCDESHKLRRRYQRARGRTNFEQLQTDFRGKRKELRKATAKSKSDAFRKLLEEVQNNPWGDAYKMVLNKTKSNKGKAPICPNIMANIVAGLFPGRNPTMLYSERPQNEHPSPPVNTEELQEAVRYIMSNNATGRQIRY